MLYRTPEEHAANPPSTWVAVRVGYKWRLKDKNGTVIATARRKKDALALRGSGFYVRLYEKEGRWFAGEQVEDWKPWKQCVAG